jgi:predicted membrane-bound mannosyltransferase
VHVRPWHAYFGWLVAEELPMFVLGAVGAAHAIWRGVHRFMVFSALWAVGMLAAYSLIPYKTPWLTLNMLAPLAICAGYACELAWRFRHRFRAALFVTALLTLGLSTGQALVLNFREYDNDRYPYVYVHTSREVLGLVQRIAQLQATHGPLTIAVTSPQQFPLSWYLRGYRVGYYNREIATGDPVVIASEDQQFVLGPMLGASYETLGVYQLRPGVRLILYVRRDLRPPMS